MASKSRRHRAVSGLIISANVIILGIVILIVVQSSHQTAADTSVGAVASSVVAPSSINPLDQVSSAAVAETIVRMGNMPEATAVVNQADSETTDLAMAPAASNVVEKPQVVRTSSFASNKDIRSYTVVAGDTVTSIATKFGITSDSIRWSNGVSGDTVRAGSVLLIPPVTGIVYTVKTGDTPASLAAKFKADQGKIIAYNDAEISGLSVGERVLIPDGTNAASIAAAVAAAPRGWSGSATYGGYNGYDFGYCTWWVAKLRAAAGNPVPTNLGNASTWAVRAAGMGLPTGSTPRVGAAVVLSTSGAGHVGYVTAVNGDGTITISEMNHEGWDVSDTRTIPSGGYQYVY